MALDPNQQRLKTIRDAIATKANSQAVTEVTALLQPLRDYLSANSLRDVAALNAATALQCLDALRDVMVAARKDALFNALILSVVTVAQQV